MSDNEGQDIKVTVNVSRNLRALPFVSAEDPIATGHMWEEWLESIEREFRFFKIESDQDKKDAIIIYGGKELARLEKSLPDPANGNMYEKIKEKLNTYYTPKKNKQHARYIFSKCTPTNEESTVAYAARLREKAATCEFSDMDDRILEHLIQTVRNVNLIQKAISKKWNLEKFIEEAGQMEDIKIQVDSMKAVKAEVAKVRQTDRHQYKPATRQPQKQMCKYCGKTGIHEPGQNCPAYGKKCANCFRYNHFAAVCRSPAKKSDMKKSRDKQNKSNYRQGRNRVKKTEVEEGSTSSDDDYFMQSIKHLHTVKKIKSPNNHQEDKYRKTVEIKIDDVVARVEPDTGADVNIMDEHQFKALSHRTTNELRLQASEIKLGTLQSALQVKGVFKAVLRNRTCGINAEFVVLKGRINSAPLLSKDTLQELGMIQIDPDGSLAEENELRIKSVYHNSEYKELIDKYKDVFDGIGQIRDKKNNTEIYARFTMKEEAAPVAQKARPVAYFLQEPLKKWLEQGVEDGLFERVPHGDPITWCSPMVVQPKPRYAGVEHLEPHMIRASIDLRVPNKYMERNRIAHNPIVEDFTHAFHDCVIFSKLDMRQGYHQLLLHPDSRTVATFSTPWGNMRPRRLVFGAKAAQDLFDEVVYRIFGDIPMCLNQRDDILIGGRNKSEHDKTLDAVLKRAAEYNITFNLEKAKFGVSEIDFYGYVFTKDGLKPDPDKVRAVKESAPPTSKADVRSFLGMLGYLSKFIPNYSKLVDTLRQLTHKDVKFKWEKEEKKAFETLKNAITDQRTLMYFDPKRPIIVRTEASFHEGISAGLFQPTDRGLQPVHFISRTMTDTEKRYSQTEKDALAIVWAKKRFRMYLLGAPKIKHSTQTTAQPIQQSNSEITAENRKMGDGDARHRLRVNI